MLLPYLIYTIDTSVVLYFNNYVLKTKKIKYFAKIPKNFNSE